MADASSVRYFEIAINPKMNKVNETRLDAQPNTAIDAKPRVKTGAVGGEDGPSVTLVVTATPPALVTVVVVVGTPVPARPAAIAGMKNAAATAVLAPMIV